MWALFENSPRKIGYNCKGDEIYPRSRNKQSFKGKTPRIISEWYQWMEISWYWRLIMELVVMGTQWKNKVWGLLTAQPYGLWT